MKLVSIIIPVYNAEKTIKETLHSVQSQKYKNIEIIIVNDGSEDNSFEIIKNCQKMDKRITLYNLDNGGVSRARNYGIDKSNGELIMFVDSDDILMPGMIDVFVNYMNDDTDMVVCGYHMFDSKGQYVKKIPVKQNYAKKEYFLAIENMQKANSFNILWNKIFKADIIKKNQLSMNETINMGEDYLFIIEYLYKINRTICIIDQDLYGYRITGTGLQATYNDKNSLSRYNRALELKKFYEKNHYPMNGINNTMLRLFYVMLFESKDKKDTLKIIYGLPEFSMCINENNTSELRYRIFKWLLKRKLYWGISIMVNISKMIRRIKW